MTHSFHFPFGALSLVLFLTAGSSSLANDIQVTGLTLTGTNTTAGTTQVHFDISWENSWRINTGPGNWDAAWVFVKFRNGNTGLWQHAQLGQNADHVAPSGSTISTGLLDPGSPYAAGSNWGVGVFIHRDSEGFGPFSANGVELHWNFAGNGIGYTEITEVKVFAVEMVLVPDGSYFLGIATGFHDGFREGGTVNPFLVSSEGEIQIENINGALWAGGSIETSLLPASYPKGFKRFYLMKHEIAQQDYVDFLNTLTRTQQNTRTGTNLATGTTSVSSRYVMSNSSTINSRNGIRCDGTINGTAPITFYCDLNGNGIGGEADDGEWIACNFLSWTDLAAYLDWSGLRPMTELEFEKACRGAGVPGGSQWAWGSTVFTRAEGTSNTGGIDEQATPSNAQFVSDGFHPGPLRVGVFARPGTSRAQAGAAFYGALEMSGNVVEQTVSVLNSTGRNYSGIHGDGDLSAAGEMNTSSWPSTDGIGSGGRGGNWGENSSVARISSRINVHEPLSFRSSIAGGRGVRTAP